MTKDKWVWMPHPGHFICGNDCRFHLNTYVGKYIVSTVGDLWPDSKIREIKARVKGIKIEGIGDAWDADYMQKIGYDTIGVGRTFETMVFRAVKSNRRCCPWKISSGDNLDFVGYNDPGSASAGHLRLCKKWAKK